MISLPNCVCGNQMILLEPADDEPEEAKEILMAFCEKCGRIRVNFSHGWVRP